MIYYNNQEKTDDNVVDNTVDQEENSIDSTDISSSDSIDSTENMIKNEMVYLNGKVMNVENNDEGFITLLFLFLSIYVTLKTYAYLKNFQDQHTTEFI